MASIVIELQRDALDAKVPVSDLLRKALVVARKLSAGELVGWIQQEMSGYKPEADLPDYREVKGRVKSWNPYHGWRPVLFEGPEDAELLSTRSLTTSVPEIENILSGGQDDSQLHMPFHPEVQRRLLEQHDYADTEVSLFLPRASLARILEAVRTLILNWSLQLEEQGVLGEGLSFTPEERQQASTQTQNIANFYGPVESPQFQQGTETSVQVRAAVELDFSTVSAFLGKLCDTLNELELPPPARAEAEAEIQTLDAQLRSPKPKKTIIREGLRSLRAILESAGGGIAGNLAMEIGSILSQ